VPREITYADSDGVSIAWRAVGDGPHDLVIVPGFVSHLEAYWDHPLGKRFLDRLTRFARVILWDKREQGLSDRLGTPPTLEQSMDDLRVVLDAAGAERPTLIGFSEGGPMSILYAATYPQRVARLVLFGSYARIVEAPGFTPGFPRAELERFFAVMRSGWASDTVFQRFAPDAAADPAVREWGRRFLRSGISPAGAQALLNLYLQIDVREVVRTLRLPTLILQRADDRIADVEHGRWFADNVPGARYVELPGADHIPLLGDQDAILDEIEEHVTGTRPQREPDRVLATVLFTDICASTERAAAMGDARWREVLTRHDSVVRAEVERHRGRVVKSMGDGALATFDGPARAIEGAAAIRAAIADLGLQIRAGLHTGECELMGEDVGGIAVHIGARVAATADPGEIRVSRTVADLVAGSGIAFEDRGEHELKGVPGSWRLLAVA
jgi:pimeloyl-ACP methyl ester carboxylesterase